MLSYVKSCNPIDQLNLHQVPSTKIFAHPKYLLSLKRYGNFHNSMYSASTIKQTLELKKTTGEIFLLAVLCTMV